MTTPAQDAETLSLHEAAAELGVHYMTAYRYVRLGMLPAHREGRSWRVLRTDLEALDREAPPEGERKRAQWDVRYARRAIAGDTAGAWAVVEAAFASGMSVPDAYPRIIIPALRRVGELWENGEISVAEEHAATAVTANLLGRLGGRITRRGVSRGSIVMGTTAADLHALPSAIASDIFRAAGFEVLDLGANLPAASFAEIAAAQPRLLAVGVSVTAPDQDEAIEATVRALRDAVAVPIMIGGPGIESVEAAQRYGADFHAASALDALPWLEDLAGG